MIRSIFTQTSKEFYIPWFKKIVFVSDYFLEELTGGAELTFQALEESCPYPSVYYMKIHSSSLTEDMIKNAPKDVLWVFGNFSRLDPTVAEWISVKENGVFYTVLEMDFKYCCYRSPILHATQTKTPCDCPSREVSQMIARFLSNANQTFWMSEAQKKKYQTLFPDVFTEEKTNHVLSSVFSKISLDALDSLVEKRSQEGFVKNQYAVLGSSSWIKGTEDAVSWCKSNGKQIKLLHGLSPIAFLQELSKCEGFVFLPKDDDTCPRVVIEAKILGLKLVLNDHVLHKSETWFETPESTRAYLQNSSNKFWSAFQIKI